MITLSPLPGDPINNRHIVIPVGNAGEKSLTVILTNNTLDILVFEAIQMGKYSFGATLEAMAKISGSIAAVSDAPADEDTFWQSFELAKDIIYPNRLADEAQFNQSLFLGLKEVQL